MLIGRCQCATAGIPGRYIGLPVRSKRTKKEIITMVEQIIRTGQETVEGVVCPVCYKPMPGTVIIQRPADRYGRVIRTYFGWCLACNAGCEVVQFQKDGKWLIEKHRPYSPEPLAWQKVNSLPESAPIVLGPGGDFDSDIELMPTVEPADIELMPVHILDGIRSVLLSVANTVRLLATIMGTKKDDRLSGK